MKKKNKLNLFRAVRNWSGTLFVKLAYSFIASPIAIGLVLVAVTFGLCVLFTILTNQAVVVP